MVTYQISFPEPGSHLVAVRLEFTAPTPAASEDPGCTVWMAAWTPGSYLVREYARNIRTASAEVDGQPALLRKLRKDSWHVEARPGQRVCIDYKVYAHELSVRTAHHDASHAFLHPAQIFLIPSEIRGPFAVEIALPDDWDAVSMCADPVSEARSPGRFGLVLPDLDTLLDTPIEAGRLHRCTLPSRDHIRLAVWGDPLPAMVLERLSKVVGQVEATWPSRPYDHYTFIVHAAVGAAGGLEHLFGSVLGVDPERFAPALRHARAGVAPTADSDDGLLDFLELAAHELFHAWNGKRLRPAILGPFDYHRENYTRELWLLEGLTSYYDRLCVLRSGQMPFATFLRRLSDDLARLASVPGRHVQSIADASFDAWIKLYRPQDDSPNASVSYYLKGSLVGLIIDLWLRKLHPEGDGLDAVLTSLWRSFEARHEAGTTAEKIYQHQGFEIDDFLEALSSQAGATPPDWLRASWERPGELDWQLLAVVGLQLSQKPAEPDGLDLGFTVQDRGGAPWVQFVYAGSPAEIAGLAPGDELLAARMADGPWLRLRTSRLRQVWDHLIPNQAAELLVARRERIHTLGLRFGAARGLPLVERLAAPSNAVQQAFHRWTLRDWNDS